MERTRFIRFTAKTESWPTRNATGSTARTNTLPSHRRIAMLQCYGGTAHKLSSRVIHFKEFVGSVRVDFLDSFWGGLSGRVPFECVQIFWIRFGGQQVLQCIDANVLFRVCCCFVS